MRSKKNRRMVLLVSCMILALGIAFATPQETYAKSGKPVKVTSFRVVGTSYNSVTLKWGAQKNVKSYQLYRATKKNGKYKKIKTLSARQYKDVKLTTGKAYWYKVRAVRGLRKGAFSAVVKGVPKLKTPTFHAASKLNGVKLTAGAVKGASGYIFYRGGKVIRTQKSPSYFDKKATSMKASLYRVAAYRSVNGKQVRSSRSKQLPAAKITAKVEIEGCTLPGTLSPSSGLKNTGTIKSNYQFRSVEIGIVNKAKNSWIRKYSRSGLKTKSFAMKNADSSFDFRNLSAGTYCYRVYVHFEGGVVHTVLNHKFTVQAADVSVPASAKTGAQRAVAWAKKIANDNSFSYGTGKRAHKRGCYFCGTNKKYKPKGYEKTYCCNPFIFAAYAHGAKDPAILKACKKGKCGGMRPTDWTQFGCFVTVGSTKSVPFSKLRTGDVIISDASKGAKYHHVWMYCGNNEYVEAGREGWDARSIAVKGNAKSNYKGYQRKGCHVMRYTGK